MAADPAKTVYALRDAYDVAEERGLTPAEAARQMAREGWPFVAHDAINGQELYAAPGTEPARIREIQAALKGWVA